jgi:hypothetical protein
VSSSILIRYNLLLIIWHTMEVEVVEEVTEEEEAMEVV